MKRKTFFYFTMNNFPRFYTQNTKMRIEDEKSKEEESRKKLLIRDELNA
jgi:hypothetical protein